MLTPVGTWKWGFSRVIDTNTKNTAEKNIERFCRYYIVISQLKLSDTFF